MKAMSLHFCISHYDGDLEDLLNCIGLQKITIYNKSGAGIKPRKNANIVNIENHGYNIYSYLSFIIDNYDKIPERVAFIKSNIYPRHITKELFSSYIASDEDFIPLTNKVNWQGLRWPQSFSGEDNMLYELNNSWYRYRHKPSYYSNYNEFFQEYFDDSVVRGGPVYLRFAPGANYIVSRDRILKGTKWFYKNLRDTVKGYQLSCESHYIERSLGLIWDSNIKFSEKSQSGPIILLRKEQTKWNEQLSWIKFKIMSILLKIGGFMARASLER